MTANNPPALAFNSGYAFQIDGDTHPTPSQIKILQSASLDMKATTKELFGQNIFPVAVGRSQIKVDGKLKFADYQPRMIRDFVGAPNNSLMAAGQTLVANNEPGSIPASSTYTVTVTNSATFGLDLGVTYAATGIPFTLVASLTAAGQYTYAAGVYTFYSGDASAAVLISYTYTVSTSGDTVTISNTAAGAANSFQTIFGASYNGLETNFLMYACIPTSFKLADFKIGDFSMPELDFSCVVNSAGNLGIISLPRDQLKMTDAAAIMAARLQDERALIFTNLLNGVPVWQVARDFRKGSEQEVMDIFRFILRKIRSRRLERMEPPIVGSSISEIQRQRIACLTILPKLNLDRDPRYKDVLHERVDLKNDGSLRNSDVLQQMKPVEKPLNAPPSL